MQKEQCLANSSNKQYFVNMLSSNLVMNNCKTYHASGDADCSEGSGVSFSCDLLYWLERTLICLFSFTIMQTQTVTTSISSPSKKRIQRCIVCGTLMLLRLNWVKKFVPTFSYSMQFLVVTQLLTSMAWEGCFTEDI